MKLSCLVASLASALALAGPNTGEHIGFEERQAPCVPGVPILNGNPQSTLQPQIKLFAVNPANPKKRFPVGTPLQPLPDSFIFPFQALPLRSTRGGVFILQNNALYGNGVLSTFSNGTNNPLEPTGLFLSSDTRASTQIVEASDACVGGKAVRALVFQGPAANVSFGNPVTKKPLAPGVKFFKPALPILNMHEVVLEIQEV